MPAVEIAEKVFWVGAVDWNIRYFHGPAYSTHRGTTYNSYLIMDDKITLVDTVYGPFKDQMLANIREIVDPAEIDIVVSNHVETDHSGGLPALMELIPEAPVYCSKKGAEGLKAHYFGDWDFHVVKSGDQLQLGRYSLTFLEAPMLHWPDSMFTYLNELALLMPNDAFGQHIATSQRFDDQVDMTEVMQEAVKYYANILTPFSARVLKKLDQVAEMGIPVNMIAPSHGIIWRKNPEKIIAAYRKWASGEGEEKAVVVYDTMWNSTGMMAHAIVDGLASTGVTVKLYKAAISDRNDIIADILNTRAVLIGSPTINRDILPVLSPLLDDLQGLKPVGKMGAGFGSYGWGGGALKTINARLQAAGIELLGQGLSTKWVPTREDLQEYFRFGQETGRKIKEGAVEARRF